MCGNLIQRGTQGAERSGNVQIATREAEHACHLGARLSFRAGIHQRERAFDGVGRDVEILSRLSGALRAIEVQSQLIGGSCEVHLGGERVRCARNDDDEQCEAVHHNNDTADAEVLGNSWILHPQHAPTARSPYRRF